MLDSDSGADIPPMTQPVIKQVKRKLDIRPGMSKGPNTKITKRKQVLAPIIQVVSADEVSSDDEQGEELTISQVNRFDSTFVEKLVIKSIREGSARACYAECVLPGKVGDQHPPGDADSLYNVKYYHGYNYPHMFGALLNTVTAIVGGARSGTIDPANVAECLENTMQYWLAVRTGLVAGKIRPIEAGTSNIHIVPTKTYSDFDCCAQAMTDGKRDRPSAIYEHVLHHFTHKPNASAHKSYRHPFGGDLPKFNLSME